MNSTPVVSPPAPDLPPPPFFLSIDLSDGRVTVHGDLDRHQVHRLAEAVGALKHSSAACWSIDVAAVTFCDVAGLRGLVEAQQVAAHSGRRLSVTRPRPWLLDLSHLTGLDLPGADRAAGTSPIAPA